MRQRDLCREWPQKAQKHKKSGTMRNDQGMRALCDQIRQTAFDLNGYLRNGHLEKVYENGMAHRLRKIGLAVERQRALQVRDEDGAILVTSEHVAQVLGYLRASGQRDAMLINFGSSRLEIKKFVL